MTPISHADAVRFVTSYVAGDDVEATVLQQAIAALSAHDPAWASRLRQEIGAEVVAPACALVRANLAEYCSMSRAERADQMPAMVKHLQQCDHCRHDYRALQRPWHQLESALQQVRKELASPVRIVIDKVSRMLSTDEDTDILFGTLSPTYGVPMGEPTPEATAWDASVGAHSALRKEWTLDDDETGFRLQFSGLVKPGTDALAISGRLLTKRGQSVPGKEVQLELRNADTDRLDASGTMDEFLEIPLELSVGNWTVDCQYNSGGTMLVWRLRMEVRGRRTDEPT